MSDKSQNAGRTNPTPGGCFYFVMRKKRFCRMTVKTGLNYCGEHDPSAKNSQNNIDDKRIPCPLDPKHTCYASKLEKHLKICNAKVGVLPAYIKKGCNRVDSDALNNSSKENGKNRTLSEVPVEVLRKVIEKVQSLYASLTETAIEVYSQTVSHRVVEYDLNNVERGNNTKKHLQQTSSLLGIIEKETLMREDTCFIELGAGRGHVSYYLAKALSDVKTASVLLVDRASHRHKQDNKLDKQQHTVQRMRADINDLMLSEVELVKDASRVVAVSKHLCGVATDFALRCVTNSSVLDKTSGIVMATCCHHRCVAESYIAGQFLQDCGISDEYFNIMCGLVSWATCGTGFSRERRRQMSQQNTEQSKRPKLETTIEDVSKEITAEIEISSATVRQKQENIESENLVIDKNKDGIVAENVQNKGLKKLMGLSVEQRTEIGRQAKIVLDYGRVKYLQEQGFVAKLCYYCDTDVSPENVCIVAIKS